MPEIRQKVRPDLTIEGSEGGSGSAADRLLPPLVDTTSAGLQSVLKSRIDKADMLSFLERKLTEEAIDPMREILDVEGSLYAISGETAQDLPGNNYQRKRLFDMAMIAMYEELVTPEKVISTVQSLGVRAAADLFEKMAVLESGMYYLEKDLSAEATSSSESIYITDGVSSIHYADPTRDSYQSLANVEEELQNIYDETLGAGTLPAAITSLIPDFDEMGKAFVRINGRRSPAEGSSIARYKFLLNYTSTADAMDRSLLRKYWAVTSDGLGGTYGYYVRDGRRVYLTGLTIATGGAEDYAYYSLLAGSYNSGYKAARDFLYALWSNTASRTIHY